MASVRVDLDWPFTASPTMRALLTELESREENLFAQLTAAYFKSCVSGEKVMGVLERAMVALFGCSWGVAGGQSYQSLRMTGASIQRNEIVVELPNGTSERLRAACALVPRIPTLLSGIEHDREGLALEDGTDNAERGLTPEWLQAHEEVLHLLERQRHGQMTAAGGAPVRSVDVDAVRVQITRAALEASGVPDVAALALRLAVVDIVSTGGSRHEIPCRLVVTRTR